MADILKQKKIKKQMDEIFGDNPIYAEMKQKVYKSLIGDYTQDDVENAKKETAELLDLINNEMEFKECINANESYVISNKLISNDILKDGNSN